MNLWIAALAALLAWPVAAAEEELGRSMSIAATVNGDAISSYDVNNRIKFIITTTKLSNTPEVLEHIRPQVLRLLIDEKLQMQDALANGVTIEDQEVRDAIAVIENQRGMELGTSMRMLQEKGIPPETLTGQVRAQLLWGKLIGRKVRPLVKVGDEEIRLAYQRLTKPKVKQELQISVLSLPVDKPGREKEMQILADKLVREVREGADFEEVSRQFSGGRTDRFWVQPDQLDPTLARLLTAAQAGMVTDAVRTDTGYTIVKVYDTRALTAEEIKNIEVTLKEILLKLKLDADPKEADVLLTIGQEVARHPGTCEEKGVASIQNLEDFDIEVEFIRQQVAKLPPALRIIAENLNIGDISTPFASSEGIRLYMLCDKREASPEPVDRERIIALLTQQKLELEAQKYLRNLRRSSFIEVR